jgi:O-antigen/teichoic acid export membrane protein
MSVSTSISAAYLPSYARTLAAGAGPTRDLVANSLRLSVSIGAPLVAVTIVTARSMLAVLFGSEYTQAADALRLLALSIGTLFLSWPVINVLIVAHWTGLFAAIRGVAAVLNIGLNLVLIPRFGIAGAAAATLAVEIGLLVFGGCFLRTMQALPSPRQLLPPLGAALCMSLVVWMSASNLSLGAQIILGGVIYVGTLGAMGGVPLGVLRDAVWRGGNAAT